MSEGIQEIEAYLAEVRSREEHAKMMRRKWERVGGGTAATVMLAGALGLIGYFVSHEQNIGQNRLDAHDCAQQIVAERQLESCDLSAITEARHAEQHNQDTLAAGAGVAIGGLLVGGAISIGLLREKQ